MAEVICNMDVRVDGAGRLCHDIYWTRRPSPQSNPRIEVEAWVAAWWRWRHRDKNTP